MIKSTEILFAIPMSLLLLLVKYIMEKNLMKPIGIYLGLKPDRAKKKQNHPVLEEAYQTSKCWSRDKINALSIQTNLTERHIERWLNVRNGYTAPTTLDKFCDSLWKFLYYSFSGTYGLIILWNEKWNINDLWADNEQITSEFWWYCTLTMAFYISLCICQFISVKRKDFWEMFLHHVISITLTALVSMTGLHRIASISLLIHDISDIILELSKCVKYLDYPRAPNIIFVFFVISWFATRTGLFPFWIIRSFLQDSKGVLRKKSIYYVWNGLALMLLGLHCFWTFLILKFTISTIQLGYVQNDIRSDTDSSDGGRKTN